MDLAQFIVLTGAQATGKSTIAKAIYYFSPAKEICFSLITGNNLPYTPIYIPAGRSIVTLMTDFMGKQITRARMVNHSKASLLEKFLLLFEQIIKGEYFYREGAEFLRVKKFDGKSADVWISFASSGQQ